MKDGKTYTGFTQNLERRIQDHESGCTKSLRHRRPLKLVYIETFENKKEALQREKFFKGVKGGVLKHKIVESLEKTEQKRSDF